MNTKKILAMIVSVAMVVAMIPAFGIVASAAEDQTIVLSVAQDAFVQAKEFNTTDPMTNENIACGPSVNVGSLNFLTAQGSGWGNYRNFYLQFDAEKIDPELVKSAKLKMVKAKEATSSCSINYNKIDATFDETTITWNTAPADGDWLGWADLNSVEKDGIVELDVTDYVKSKVNATETTSIGFKIAYRNSDQIYVYSKEYDNGAKAATLEIVLSSLTGVTVNYVCGNDVIGSFTDTALVGDSYTPETPGSGVMVFDNVAYDVVSKTTIDSLSATASENTATVTLSKKFNIVKSFIDNGDFETGDLTSWDGLSSDWFEVQDGANGIGSKVLYSKATAWLSHEACAIGGERSFQKLVTGIESGKVYYYTADVYTGGSAGLWMNYSFLKSETPMTYDNTGDLYVTDGAQTNCTTESCADGTQLSAGYGQQWHTFSGLVTADENSKAFEFDVYYLHDSVGSKIDNVAFYETDLAATTINYEVDGVPVGSVTEPVLPGETLEVPAKTFYYDGAIYNAEAATADAGKTVTVTAVKDETKTVASFDGFVTQKNGGTDSSAGFEIYAKTDNENDMYITGITDGVLNIVKDADEVSTVGEGSVDAGRPRIGLVSFPVPADYTDGKVVNLNLYVYSKHKQLKGNTRMAVIPTDYDVASAPDNGGTVDTSEVAGNDAPVSFADITACTQSSGDFHNEPEWITADVTEAVKAAKAAGEDSVTFFLSLPTGLAKAAIMEKAGFNGAYEGKVAYLTVVDGETVTVNGVAKITKNGSNVTGTTVTIADGGYVNAYDADGNRVKLINDADGTVVDTITAAGTYSYIAVPAITASLGINAAKTAFVIDLMFNDTNELVDGVTYGIKVTGLDGTTEIADATLDEGNVGFTFEANPFRTYNAAVTLDGVAGGTFEIKSIYEMAIEEIVNGNYNTTDNKITETNKALIKNLLEEGGKEMVTAEDDVQLNIYDADGNPLQVLINAGLAEASEEVAE